MEWLSQSRSGLFAGDELAPALPMQHRAHQPAEWIINRRNTCQTEHCCGAPDDQDPGATTAHVQSG